MLLPFRKGKSHPLVTFNVSKEIGYRCQQPVSEERCRPRSTALTKRVDPTDFGGFQLRRNFDTKAITIALPEKIFQLATLLLTAGSHPNPNPSPKPPTRTRTQGGFRQLIFGVLKSPNTASSFKPNHWLSYGLAAFSDYENPIPPPLPMRSRSSTICHRIPGSERRGAGRARVVCSVRVKCCAHAGVCGETCVSGNVNCGSGCSSEDYRAQWVVCRVCGRTGRTYARRRPL